MSMELYTHWISTKCTMIQLLIQHTNIEVALREIDVFPTEENKDGRLKANINIRTVGRINFFTGEDGIGVPKLVIDRRKVIADTKAILIYLCENVCDNDLYPTDKRDDVNTSLSFVVDTLGDLVAEIYYLDIVSRKTTDLDRVELLNKTLEELETSFLKDDSFICGNDITIADLCLSVITSTLEAVNHDLTDFPKTVLHLRKCKELIQGWEECASFRAKRYGHWYRVAAEASKSGGCPYFRMPKQEIDPHVYSSDIELYTCSLLPRSLIIQLLARNVDLELTIKLVDLCHREETDEGRQEADKDWNQMLDHLYFSDNEEADFPILIDNGEVVVETERILTYILEKQETSDMSKKLYPSESNMRDLIKTWLTTDLDELDSLVLDTYIRSFENVRTKRTLDQEKIIAIKNVLKKLEQNLEENDFLAGNHLTIADIAYAVVLSFVEVVDADIFLDFGKVSLYLKTCKSLITGWDDVCEPGLKLLREWYSDLMDWTENGNCPYYNG